MSGSANTLGGYEIVREIARSNDIVYEARDPAMNRRIALKELALPPNLVGQDRRERIERFYREARAAGNLAHSNIVRIFKVGEDNGRHFIAMEFLEGDTLRNQLQVGGPLSVQRAVEVCSQICDALEYAHQHGVVHRDVKPDNIQILPDGTPKLTDFGIARLGAEPGITQAGQVFGTPSYMSPEQITGKPVDRRSDVFAMGVMLYECLTGRKPFTGDSVVTITYNIINMEPMAPPGVPPHLQQIVRKAMAKLPEHRYQSAGDMLRDLRQPAPAAMPFGNTQHVTSLPRVNPMTGRPDPVSPPGWGGGQAGFGNVPVGGAMAPASGYTGGSGYPGPTGYAGTPLTGGYGSGLAPTVAPHPGAFGAPQGNLPAVNLPPLPPPRSSGAREFVVRQAPFLTLLSLVLVFVMIAIGVFWALKSGYEGYENTTVRTDLMKANADAVNFLNRGDYEHAFPRLQYVLNNTPSGSPLYASAQHNMGTAWFLSARAAQQRGDLQHAKNDYTNSLPLLPDRRDEITQVLKSMDLALSGSGAHNDAIPPAPDNGLQNGNQGPSSIGMNEPKTPATGSTVKSTATVDSPPSGGSGPNDNPGPVQSQYPSKELEVHFDDEYQSGVTAYYKGDFRTAITIFEQYRRDCPNCRHAMDAKTLIDVCQNKF